MNIRQIQKIHVESNIPLPARKSIRVFRRRWHEDLSSMKPNDSFIVAKGARPAVYQAARQLGMNVESREIDTYHVRVFIVDKKGSDSPQVEPENGDPEDEVVYSPSNRHKHRPNEAIVI